MNESFFSLSANDFAFCAKEHCEFVFFIPRDEKQRQATRIHGAQFKLSWMHEFAARKLWFLLRGATVKNIGREIEIKMKSVWYQRKDVSPQVGLRASRKKKVPMDLGEMCANRKSFSLDRNGKPSHYKNAPI